MGSKSRDSHSQTIGPKTTSGCPSSRRVARFRIVRFEPSLPLASHRTTPYPIPWHRQASTYSPLAKDRLLNGHIELREHARDAGDIVLDVNLAPWQIPRHVNNATIKVSPTSGEYSYPYTRNFH